MSDNIKKMAERALDLVKRLAAESAKGIPIIVEGKKDVDALHKLGVEGDIISAKTSGRSFLDVLREVEKGGEREVILLMDFDRHGREWTKRLARRFERMRIKYNLVFWRGFRGLLGREVKDVEGLATYLETLSEKGKVNRDKLIKLNTL